MDFKKLALKIEVATRQAFSEMVKLHGSEGIYGFALYSDEGAMTVCPSTNTLKHLAESDPNDRLYYKYEPATWKYEMEGADEAFEEISSLLNGEVMANEEDEDWFDDFQKKLFETCVKVLEKLKNEGFFKKTAGKDIFLTFTVSDYDFEPRDMERIAKRLNDNAYTKEYVNWIRSM